MNIVLAFIVTFLAYAKGANENFIAVATPFGSGTASLKRAIGWATKCTLTGSICAVAPAGKLLKIFLGKGLIEESLIVKPGFAACVAVRTGLTVRLRLRVSRPSATSWSVVRVC